MSLFSRITIFNDENGVEASGLNNEFNNTINTLNNMDSGVTAWNNANVNTLVVNTKATVPNGSSATDAMAFGQNHVFQIVSFTTTTSKTTTSSTFQATSLTLNITPSSASHKVLILVSGMIENDNTGINAYATIARNGTNLGAATGFMICRANGLTVNLESASAVYLDSPATTSATTYAVYVANNDNSSSVSWGTTGTQSIVLIEVA